MALISDISIIYASLNKVRSPNDLESCFLEDDGYSPLHCSLTTVVYAFFLITEKSIADLAVRSRLPRRYYDARELAGGQGFSSPPGRTVSTCIFGVRPHTLDKILKGTKPADLPVEQAKEV